MLTIFTPKLSRIVIFSNINTIITISYRNRFSQILYVNNYRDITISLTTIWKLIIIFLKGCVSNLVKCVSLNIMYTLRIKKQNTTSFL